MQFGIRLPNSGPLANRENIILVAKEAEAQGYHSVWVHDHVLWRTEQHRTHLSAGSTEALEDSQKPNFYESITTLSYLAGITKSVCLGVAVLVLPLRNPLLIAKQLANLDVLSGGRVIAGVAPGAPVITKGEFEAFGVSYEARGKITDEYIAAIRKIWSENLPSYSGQYTKFDEVQVFPKPLHNIKLLVGGGERGISRRALRRVVELGDGWIPAYLTPEEAAQGIREIKLAVSSAKKNPDSYFIAHEMFSSIDRDLDQAKKRALQSLSSNFVSIDDGIRRSLIGEPPEIVKKLKVYESAGVDLTELKFIYSDVSEILEMMRLFSQEVLARFKV